MVYYPHRSLTWRQLPTGRYYGLSRPAQVRDRGRLRFRIAGVERVVGTGERVVVPPGVPHHFWVERDAEAHHRQEFRPALRTEDFFEALFGLARDGKLDARGMPPLLMLSVFGHAFWNEIRVTRPPEWVQRLTHAVLAPLGRGLGQHLPVS